MIHKSTYIHGLDEQIGRLQDWFYDTSRRNVGLPWINSSNTDQFDIYGKLTQVSKTNGLVLVWHDGKEHQSIFHNDKVTATVGFRVLERSVADAMSASVDVICTVNLKELYGTDERQDERAMLEFRNTILKSGLVFEITGHKERNDNVFNGLDVSRFQGKDVYPRHAFAYTITLPYRNNLSAYD